MKIIRFPNREAWPEILARPQTDTGSLEGSVREIVDAVRQGGDDAIRSFTKRFDGVDINELRVSETEIAEASSRVPDDLKAAIDLAKNNIEKFHVAQHLDTDPIETMPGILCWSRSVGIERVGLYIPAGSAPLFSTVLMLGVPAKIAGCREIVLCSPPNSDGRVDDTVLYTAAACGINAIFKVGGAQAIAAMAYGTETIPRVYKIFGPGNSIVTCAKQLVSMDLAIDMPAGPSEVAVLADDSAVPAFVAADLLSQAEHGPDSQVVLVTDSAVLIDSVLNEIGKQIRHLPRQAIAESSLANSKAILVRDLDEGADLLNDYAAEHLIIAAADADNIANKIISAGSVFIGNYSCESAGDYASGTNHTLPTGGFANAFSGVSVASFSKKITFQKLSADGIRNIGPAVELMAAAEGLEAHKMAITVRLEALNGV
jgi:histidinol dehydrogenase